MDIAALNSTKTLRKQVLEWMCICFGCLSLIFAGFNLTVNHLYAIGVLEVGFTLLCLYIFKQSKLHHAKRWHAISMCLSITTIVLFGSYLAPLKNGLFLWIFILPTLYYLLLGRRYGLVLSATLLILQAAILSQKLPTSAFAGINLGLNLLFIYTSMWAISHVFEANRAKFSNRLRSLALLDPLTGAGNRLSMNHFFEIELKDKSQLYLFLLDLDYFKQINDKYGHEVGDKVLVELTTQLRVIFAKGYVFRVGGEEFALMGMFESPQAALAMAEKLRFGVATKPINASTQQLNLTASVGVVRYQQQSLAELIDQADKQLYKAKAAGRNTVVSDIDF